MKNGFVHFLGGRRNQAKNLDQQRLLDDARALVARGDVVAAHGVLDALLALAPELAEVHVLRGRFMAQAGDDSNALEAYGRALAIDSHYAKAHYYRANLHRTLGRMQDAIADYNRAATLDPFDANTFCNRGVAIAALGMHEDSLGSFEQALRLNPEDVFAYFNRAASLRSLHRNREALADYLSALDIQPGYGDALFNAAMLLAELDRGDEALLLLARYDQINTRSADAHNLRGTIFRKQGDLSRALEEFTRATELRADSAEAHCNKGLVETELRRYHDASASLCAALRVDSTMAAAHYNLGNLYVQLRQDVQAVDCFDRALELDSGYTEACLNRAVAFSRLKRFPEAIADFGRVLDVRPEAEFVHGMLRHARMCICDWDDFETDVTAMLGALSLGKAVTPPFALLALTECEAAHQQAAEIWCQKRVQHRIQPRTSKLDPVNRRIRVGCFSSDFHAHPVGELLAPVLEQIDRVQFEVYGFSLSFPTGDATQKRIAAGVDHFIDVSGLADQAVTALAKQLEIDIAIDLNVYSGDSRPAIFAGRAAPVQVNYLGYPGTSGADYMDYIVGDGTVLEAARQEFYSEKFVTLPESFLPMSNLSAEFVPIARLEAGLPPIGRVFCCFNAAYKIVPEMFCCWMRILRLSTGSVLWLSVPDLTARANLRMAADRYGIDPQRLIFAERVEGRAEYLARLRCADVFLDTLPYGAHATAIDALVAGLPVLTVGGSSFAGRVGASLLRSLGLHRWIATSLPEYEELAVSLSLEATLSEFRAELGRAITGRRQADTARYARVFGSALKRMHNRYSEDLPPDHLRFDAGTPRVRTDLE